MKLLFRCRECLSLLCGPDVMIACSSPPFLVFRRFIPEPWSACSTTCGPGVQVREVKCRVLLTFTQTETELPEEECEGPQLPTERPCLLKPCDEGPASSEPDTSLQEDSRMTYHWEYAGFTPCTATCLGGTCFSLQGRSRLVLLTIGEITKSFKPNMQVRKV